MTPTGIPRVPVYLVLRDRRTGREVPIPSDEVWIEVRNDLSQRSKQNLLRDPEIVSKTVTVEADFSQLGQHMRRPVREIETRKEIEQ